MLIIYVKYSYMFRLE